MLKSWSLLAFSKLCLHSWKNLEIICFFWSEATEFLKNISRILIRKTSAISFTKHDLWKKILDFKIINGFGCSSKPPKISKSSFRPCFLKDLKNTRSASLFFWATVTAYLQSQADIFRGLKADFHVASTCSNFTSLLENSVWTFFGHRKFTLKIKYWWLFLWDMGGFQLLNLIIAELKSHMTS